MDGKDNSNRVTWININSFKQILCRVVHFQIVDKKVWRGNMDIDDHQACTSMDVAENDGSSDDDGIHWHFSQVKGNVEPDGGITSDGEIL